MAEVGWGQQGKPGWEQLMLASAAQQAGQFNSSPFSQFVNAAGAEAGGKLGAAGWSALEAMMLPGRVASGEVPFDPRVSWKDQNPATLDAAANLAGNVGLSSLPIPKPANSLGMFGGVRAKTANLDALQVAKALEASGATRDSIWNATGWFKGADGQWRFEIPDSAATMKPSQMAQGSESPTSTNPLSNVMSHRRLYEAYPEVGDISASLRMAAGDHDGTYYAPRTVGKRLIEGISGQAPTIDGIKSVTLHEAQHAIQQRENFAQGSSPTMGGNLQDEVWAAAKQAYQESDGDAALLRELGIDTPDVQMKPWDELTRREQLGWLERGRQRLYYRSAGEVEARNVQARMNMTPEQRKAKAPWLTQDVPDNLQIIRMMGS